MKATSIRTVVCFASAIMCGAALAQTPITLLNPDFESPGTYDILSGFDAAGEDIPGWMNTGGAYTDTGVQSGGQSGGWEGYTQTGEGGAYQISGYQIQAGDLFTLTWYARGEWNGSSGTYDGAGPNDAKQTVTFLSAATPGADLASTSTLAVHTNGVPGGANWQQYTLTYQSVPADVGRFVGVSFVTAKNSGSGTGTWTGFDDFSLAVLTLPAGSKPVVVTPPASQTAFLGRTVNFTVTAAGTGLGYQWQRGAVGGGVYANISDGGQFSGATTATLVITNVQSGDAADYVVVVSNAGGSVTSAPPATLTLDTSLPTIVTPPAHQAAAFGSVVTLSVVATGEVSYQWKAGAVGSGVHTNISDGGQFSGATTNKLVITGFQSDNVADYVVVVSNGAGSVTSSPPASVRWNLIANSRFDEMPGTAEANLGYDALGYDIPNWMNTGGDYTDTGVQLGWNSGVVSGIWSAYTQTGDGGAYQISDYRIRTGDSFTLTWYAQGEWNGDDGTSTFDGSGPSDPQQTVTILRAATTTAPFESTATLATQTNGLPGGQGWIQYTLTYNSVPADVGQYIGVSFITAKNSNTGGGTWAGYDYFSLLLNGPPPSTTPTIQRSGTNLTVTLPYGTLLQSTKVSGPWTTNMGTSPYVITPTNSMMFFRGQLH